MRDILYIRRYTIEKRVTLLFAAKLPETAPDRGVSTAQFVILLNNFEPNKPKKRSPYT